MGLSLHPPACASMMSDTSDSREGGGQSDGEDRDTLSVSDICQLDGAAISDESDTDMDQNDDEDGHSDDGENIDDVESRYRSKRTCLNQSCCQ